LNKYRQKKESASKIPILPITYNQKMNAYFKELTFHIALHTFTTTLTLTNGVPIESVSKMLGHKNLRTTQHYAKVLDKKVSDDMQILKGKFINLNTTNSFTLEKKVK